MLFKTEGLYDRYAKCIEKYKNEGHNIKDIVYGITLGDYFERQVEGVSRLNIDKITLLCTVEPNLAQLLEIEPGHTAYTEVDEVNIKRLLYSLLVTLHTGSIRILGGEEEDIIALLEKEEPEETSELKVVEELLGIADTNKTLAKRHNGLSKYCYDVLDNNASEAEQVLAVFDVLLMSLFGKDNAVDEAMLRVKLYEKRQQLGTSKFNYTWHISEDVYDKLQQRKYIKKLLYANFNIKKQSKKLYKADEEDLMKLKASFADIIGLLF